MYKFGISYYIMSAASRIPLSNVDIRLVRPGADFESGIKLREVKDTSGYYETDTLKEAECGFYEIWDDRISNKGAFSGKSCTVGKLDARGIQNSSIYTYHVENEAITSDKLSPNSVQTKHIKDGIIPLSKLIYEIQDETRGVGEPSQRTPPSMEEDDISIHTLDKEYDFMPHIILVPWCDSNLHIKDATLEGNTVKVVIAKGQRFDAPEWRYTLLVISSE